MYQFEHAETKGCPHSLPHVGIAHNIDTQTLPTHEIELATAQEHIEVTREEKLCHADKRELRTIINLVCPARQLLTRDHGDH